MEIYYISRIQMLQRFLDVHFNLTLNFEKPQNWQPGDFAFQPLTRIFILESFINASLSLFQTVNVHQVFTLTAQKHLRRYNGRLFMPHCWTRIPHNFFTLWAIDVWNTFPEVVKHSLSKTTFQRILDSYLGMQSWIPEIKYFVSCCCFLFFYLLMNLFISPMLTRSYSICTLTCFFVYVKVKFLTPSNSS